MARFHSSQADDELVRSAGKATIGATFSIESGW